MDYKKTDRSQEAIDKVIRSSVQSDSSQWSLSSLSSIEFDKLPSSLAKFDQFLNIGSIPGDTPKLNLDSKPKAATKFMKTPMQTIKEMATPTTTDSDFTILS